MVTRASLVATVTLWCLALCACDVPGFHGPAEDHSRFESAALMQDHTVLLSFKHLVYRPAKGIAAFPDGGIPRYVKDQDVLATFHIPSGTLRILRREQNRRWSHGQGQYSIQRAKGSTALVTQGGQLRRELATMAYDDWLVDIGNGSLQPVDWRTALAARGRAMTEMYLVDTRGTLLFVTTPSSPNPATADESDVWIWIRSADGEYIAVANTSHYEGMDGDDLVYWIPQPRHFEAFNLLTRTARKLPGYRVPPLVDATEGVNIATDGQRILWGHKRGDGWEYAPLPLEPARLK